MEEVTTKRQEYFDGNFNLRRFSKPEMLRRIDRKHLIAFLEPHAAYFSARGVELPPVQQEDGLDYNALSHFC
jgi:hypothetical protein